MNIAIIGAGLSGCHAYHVLSSLVSNITIFEKSRGTGGRLSTKYIHDYYIDHGTSSIYSKEAILRKFLEHNVNDMILKKEDNHFIATGGMNKVCSSLIDKNDLKTNTKIINAIYENNQWHLKDDQNNDYTGFDILILTIPSEQILQMDIKLEPQTISQLKKIDYVSIATLICYVQDVLNLQHPNLKKSDFFL